VRRPYTLGHPRLALLRIAGLDPAVGGRYVAVARRPVAHGVLGYALLVAEKT
jgi:hypothetical protein